MPQGGKLSYKDLVTCVADAKKAGVSTKPCEDHFGSKKKNNIDPVPQPDARRNKKKGQGY